MKEINLDLGYKFDDHLHSPSEVDRDETMYPSFHFEGKEKPEIPHEGTMTIRYKKTSSSMSESKSGKRYSCSVEVRKIVSAESSDPEAPTKSNRETEDALDKIKSDMGEKY